MSRQRGPLPPPSWTVAIENHVVAGRWLIAEQTIVLPAVDAAHARWDAIGIAQRAAGVSPWKPWRRESWKHTSARRGGASRPSIELRRAA
jgi:hypothetical protein